MTYDPQKYAGRAVPRVLARDHGIVQAPGGRRSYRIPVHHPVLAERPAGAQVSLGADGDVEGEFEVSPEVKAILEQHTATLAEIQKHAAEQLLFRKIATVATVAGAAFAMLRLTDIWIALQERKERRASGSVSA